MFLGCHPRVLLKCTKHADNTHGSEGNAAQGKPECVMPLFRAGDLTGENQETGELARTTLESPRPDKGQEEGGAAV